MRNILHDLHEALWRFVHPEVNEPDYDEVSDAARRQWVATHRHPEACRFGCQCQFGKEVKP